MDAEDLSAVDMAAFVDDYDDWICVVCQYGDSASNGARELHACGNHEFHTECLVGLRARGNMRCPVCRCPPDAPVPPTQISEVIFDNDSEEDSSVGGMTNLEYQRNPHHNRVPTVVPDIIESMERTTENCTYCRFSISHWGHWILTACRHRIHISCALSNMRRNGVNLNNGAIFCPRCFHGGIHQKYFE
jgi:hypothetical protein